MKNHFVSTANHLVKKGDQFIKKSGIKSFHHEATRLLSEANMHELFDFESLVQMSFNKNFIHLQNFKNLEFSDLPITVARGNNCFIDVYFWRRRPTTIHNHHFMGAFQCLHGFNVDSEYSFKPTKKLTKFHSLGKLELKRIRTLEKGDVESINLQEKFIHQNHHQADLTVNLCFRTPDFEKKNLSNFLFSGFKFEKDFRSLARANRLIAFTRIEDFDPRKLNLTLMDALNFLLLTYGSESSHPRFLALHEFLSKKVLKETGIKLSEILKAHDDELDRIEAEYE